MLLRVKSLTTAVSDEKLEVQAREGGSKTKHGSEDDLGCDKIDNCGILAPVAGRDLEQGE